MKLDQTLQFDIGPAHFINITNIGSGWQVRELKGDNDMEPLRLVSCVHRIEKDDAIAIFCKKVLAATGRPNREVAEEIQRTFPEEVELEAA